MCDRITLLVVLAVVVRTVPSESVATLVSTEPESDQAYVVVRPGIDTEDTRWLPS